MNDSCLGRSSPRPGRRELDEAFRLAEKGSNKMANQASTEKVIKGGTATVYVSNMDRAVAFYTDTLGLTLVGRYGDEYASVDAGDRFHIGLHPTGPRSPKPGTPGSIQISFGVHGRIDDVVGELTRRGVSFRGAIIDDDPVKLAVFTDPDGNELCLCEYKGGTG